MRGSWTPANGVKDGYQFKETDILRVCSVLIRLLIVSFHFRLCLWQDSLLVAGGSTSRCCYFLSEKWAVAQTIRCESEVTRIRFLLWSSFSSALRVSQSQIFAPAYLGLFVCSMCVCSCFPQAVLCRKRGFQG